MRRTKDLRALDLIEEMFGRVSFLIPKHESKDEIPILRLAGKLMQEFGGYTQALASALGDGPIAGDKAAICLKELNTVLASCIELKAHLERHV